MLIILLPFILYGCTTAAIVKKATNATIEKATSFKVAKGRVKVYFIQGINRSNLLWTMNHHLPSDIYVNGEKIGSKNEDDVMVVELKPGKYNFLWKARTTDLIDKQAVSEILKKNLISGDIMILQSDYDVGAAGSFGLIGSLVGKPPKLWFLEVDIDSAKSEITGNNIVVPQECRPELCLK